MRAVIIAAALACTAPSVHAGDYFAAPSGSDAHDCLSLTTPCLTATAAVRKMPVGHHSLGLAAGTYDEIIDVSHARQVAIYGPHDDQGACAGANAVTVRQVSVQDNATIWGNCLTTGAVSCRQWAIADVADVIFDGSQPVALTANETCRINTAGTLSIGGPIAAFAVAQNYSTIFLSGQVIVTRPNMAMVAFVRAIDSTLDLSLATFGGHPFTAGRRFWLDHSVIVFPTAGAGSIPGNGSKASNNSICRPSCDQPAAIAR